MIKIEFRFYNSVYSLSHGHSHKGLEHSQSLHFVKQWKSSQFSCKIPRKVTERLFNLKEKRRRKILRRIIAILLCYLKSIKKQRLF